MNISQKNLPSVLDITGRAELKTKIDTQFPMICGEKERTVSSKTAGGKEPLTVLWEPQCRVDTQGTLQLLNDTNH